MEGEAELEVGSGAKDAEGKGASDSLQNIVLDAEGEVRRMYHALPLIRVRSLSLRAPHGTGAIETFKKRALVINGITKA